MLKRNDIDLSRMRFGRCWTRRRLKGILCMRIVKDLRYFSHLKTRRPYSCIT